jgi:hypothetical protein
MTAPTWEQIARLTDDHTEVEWLARSISLSLRSMDISIEQIAEFYYEQLVNLMAAGLIADTQNQTLFAHVHTFFLHLGAARDYLAALIAARIRKNPSKIDSMANLTEVLEPQDVETDALLKLLENRKFIQPTPSNMNRLEISGWLKEATTLRMATVWCPACRRVRTCTGDCPRNGTLSLRPTRSGRERRRARHSGSCCLAL